MIESDNYIVNPGISDAKALLKEDSNDLATLCTSNNINIWSKYKPIYWGKLIDVYNNQNWYKGKNGTCGIKVPAYTSSYSEIPSKYDGNMNGWGREEWPTNEEVAYRLADFNNYYHNAVPFLGGFITDDPPIYIGETVGASVWENTESANNRTGGSLTLSDIDEIGDFKFSDLYLGMVLTDTNGNVKGAIAGNGHIKLACYFDTNTVGIGTYTCYPFLASEPFDSSKDLENNSLRLYPLPNVTPVTIKIKDIEAIWTFEYQWEDLWTIAYKFTVKFPAGNSRTYSSNTISLWDISFEDYIDKQNNLGDSVTISTSETTFEGKFENITNPQGYEYYEIRIIIGGENGKNALVYNHSISEDDELEIISE